MAWVLDDLRDEIDGLFSASAKEPWDWVEYLLGLGFRPVELSLPVEPVRARKICARPECGKAFSRRPQAKYCSDYCRHKSRAVQLAVSQRARRALRARARAAAAATGT